MLDSTVAVQVGIKFLHAFYRAFVVNGGLANGLQEFYGPASRVAVLGHPTMNGSATGKEILGHLSTIDRILQERKVDIISLDTTPLPDGSVQLLCHLTLFLRSCKWSIIHVFVLSPTQYRPNTFFISSEHLCFLSLTKEKTPEGMTLLDPRQVAAVLAENAKHHEEEAQRRLREEEEAAIVLERELRKREEEAQLAEALRQQKLERERELSEESEKDVAQRGEALRKLFADFREKREEPQRRFDNPNFRQRFAAPHEGREGFLRKDKAESFPSEKQRRNQREQSRGERGRSEKESRRGPAEGAAPLPAAESAPKRNPNFRQGNSKAAEQPQKQERQTAQADGVVAALPQENTPATSAGASHENGNSLPKRNRRNRSRKDKKTVEERIETKLEEKKEAPAATATKPRASRRSGPTKEIRIVSLPESVSLDLVREVLRKKTDGVPATDLYRFGHGKGHLIAKFESESVAEKVYKGNTIDIAGANYKVLAFYE